MMACALKGAYLKMANGLQIGALYSAIFSMSIKYVHVCDIFINFIIQNTRRFRSLLDVKNSEYNT